MREEKNGTRGIPGWRDRHRQDSVESLKFFLFKLGCLECQQSIIPNGAPGAAEATLHAVKKRNVPFLIACHVEPER